ncbi:hypothetical protein CYMTET_49066, partial [Cymbomonas tetramitiformis]
EVVAAAAVAKAEREEEATESRRDEGGAHNREALASGSEGDASHSGGSPAEASSSRDAADQESSRETSGERGCESRSAVSSATAGCSVQTPKYTVAEVDIGEDGERAQLVEVLLPGIDCMGLVDLDVGKRSVTLKVKDAYAMHLQLQHEVRIHDVVAKFKKKKCLLTISMPIIKL